VCSSDLKKALIFFLLFMAFGAQAQVIPVGFIKTPPPRVFTNQPTGTNPVTSNLLFYLDATRTASYGGTGTTWTDISGSSNSATLTNSPSYGFGNASNGSGSFTFASNKYALTSTLIPSLSSATFIAWINPSGTQNQYTGIIFSRGGASGATAPATGLNFYSNNAIGYSWNDSGSTWGWNSGLQAPRDEWSMVAVTINSSTAIVYLCQYTGITTASNTSNTTPHPTVSGLKFYIGSDPNDLSSRAIVGKIATSMVYASALTQTNIVDIYNAQKAAFGL
jgi:hypothetical protein